MPPPSFFADFPSFDHDTTASLADEFNRLSIHQGWKGTKRHQKKAQCFAVAFEATYNEGSKLDGWQKLCEDVGIVPPPLTVTQCKKVSRKKGKQVRKFPTRRALQQYSISSGKIFPKKTAKADGFLSALLILMFE